MSYSEAKFAAMSDVEVVRELWAAIAELEDPEVGDEFYWLTGEILERWAPEVEKLATELDYKPEELAREMEAHGQALARRARLRKLLRGFQEEVVNA